MKKLCKDCQHFRPESGFRCTAAPVDLKWEDPVLGVDDGKPENGTAWAMRFMRNSPCGHDALLFWPKQPPETPENLLLDAIAEDWQRHPGENSREAVRRMLRRLRAECTEGMKRSGTRWVYSHMPEATTACVFRAMLDKLIGD